MWSFSRKSGLARSASRARRSRIASVLAVQAGASVLAHAVGDEPEPGPEHVRMLLEAGVGVTPTLARFYALHRYRDEPTLLDDPFLMSGLTGEAIESARQAPIHRMEGLPDFMRHRLLGTCGERHHRIGDGSQRHYVQFPGFQRTCGDAASCRGRAYAYGSHHGCHSKRRAVTEARGRLWYARAWEAR
jgi:hypothetical protein